MPPLLAALLMIELGCDLRIVEAIDRGQEWRESDKCARYADSWYAGWLGHHQTAAEPLPRFVAGSFWWPLPRYGQRYDRH
jgi:hypothetical protein